MTRPYMICHYVEYIWREMSHPFPLFLRAISPHDRHRLHSLVLSVANAYEVET